MNYVDGSIASDAVKLINGSRDADYGPPEDALIRVARYWSAHLGTAVTASDVAKMMLLLKLARTSKGYKRDSFVDGVAYLLIAEDLDNGNTN